MIINTMAIFVHSRNDYTPFSAKLLIFAGYPACRRNMSRFPVTGKHLSLRPNHDEIRRVIGRQRRSFGTDVAGISTVGDEILLLFSSGLSRVKVNGSMNMMKQVNQVAIVTHSSAYQCEKGEHQKRLLMLEHK